MKHPKLFFLERYERHYHSRHKHGLKHLIADILGLAIILSLVIFIAFVFWGYNRGLIGRLVDLRVSASPDLLISGEDVTLKFQYQNQSEQSVADASLQLSLPPEFTLTKYPETFSLSSKSIFIGDLAPGVKGEVQVSGQLLGEVGSRFKPVASLSFEPTRFAFLSTNKVAARPAFTIIDSALKVTIEAPEETAADQDFEFKIKYENTSLINTLRNVLVGENKLGNLLPGQQGEIASIARAPGKGIRQHVLRVEGRIVHDNKSLLQVSVQKSIKIFYPKLRLELISDKRVANLGEQINFTIKYANEEDFNAGDVLIAAELPQEFFDLRQAKAEGGKKVNRFIHFDKSSVPRLAELKSGQSGELKFSARLKTVAPLLGAGTGPRNFAVIKLTARYGSDQSQRLYQVSTENGIKINSDLNLSLAAHYFSADGEQLGRGPLPPRVGKETKYWIFLTASNSINNLSDVVARLRLPANVKWTGRATVSGGEAWQIDSSSGELVWRVGSLPISVKSLTAGLELGLTPFSDQASTEPSLISRSYINGQDSFTGQEIERHGNAVTTRLTDAEAAGKSFVGR